MILNFYGKIVLDKFLTVIKVPPRICRTLSFFYALLSLAGSIWLLKHRKDLVEEYNEIITDETMCMIVFLLAHFWYLSNVLLFYGVLCRNVICTKIHLYFVMTVFAGIAAILLTLGFMVMSYGIMEGDKNQISWIELSREMIQVTLGFVFYLDITFGIMFILIASIRYITMQGLEPENRKPAEELNQTQAMKIAKDK